MCWSICECMCVPAVPGQAHIKRQTAVALLRAPVSERARGQKTGGYTVGRHKGGKGKKGQKRLANHAQLPFSISHPSGLLLSMDHPLHFLPFLPNLPEWVTFKRRAQSWIYELIRRVTLFPSFTSHFPSTYTWGLWKENARLLQSLCEQLVFGLFFGSRW